MVLICKYLNSVNKVWLKLIQWIYKKRFLMLSMIFRYFVIISPWKKADTFILTNLNPLYPRILCAKFSRNWRDGSGEGENVKTLQTEDEQQAIRKSHWSFQLRWAKNWTFMSSERRKQSAWNKREQQKTRGWSLPRKLPLA